MPAIKSYEECINLSSLTILLLSDFDTTEMYFFQGLYKENVKNCIEFNVRGNITLDIEI